MHYLEQSEIENAGSEVLKKIHTMVQTVKQEREVSIEYMKIFEREQLIREDGRIEGRLEGIIQIIRKKRDKHMASEAIAELLELDQEYVEKVVTLLEENPEKNNTEIAKEML